MSEIELQGHSFVRKSNKLVGDKNYHVLQLRMKSMLIRENIWPIIEVKRKPTMFLALIGKKYYTISTLQQEKNRVNLEILISICNELVDKLMEKLDHVDAWNSLKKIYQSGDQFQIILINS